MTIVTGACGVLCSGCAAYMGESRGAAHQQAAAAAWNRIYGMHEEASRMSCHGCLAPDEEVFHSSRGCKARRCCLEKGLASCAACSKADCELLEKAQSVWDGVPAYEARLSRADFAAYAEPYCGHRARLDAARAAARKPHTT